MVVDHSYQNLSTFYDDDDGDDDHDDDLLKATVNYMSMKEKETVMEKANYISMKETVKENCTLTTTVMAICSCDDVHDVYVYDDDDDDDVYDDHHDSY